MQFRKFKKRVVFVNISSDMSELAEQNGLRIVKIKTFHKKIARFDNNFQNFTPGKLRGIY